MAQLQQFQQRGGVEPASLQAIPTRTISSGGDWGNALKSISGFGKSIAKSYAGAEEDRIEKEQEAVVGSFTSKLLEAQQVGATDPRYNTRQQQRRIFQKAVADHPELAKGLTKQFNAVTGVKAGGLSDEQVRYNELVDSATDARFITPGMTPEKIEEQVNLYQDMERRAYNFDFEMKEMNRKIKQGTLDETARERKAIEQAGTLATQYYTANQNKVDALIQSVERGEISQSAAMQEIAMMEINHRQQIASFGEFANNPSIAATLEPSNLIFQYGKDRISGKFDQESYESSTALIRAQNEYVIMSDKKNAQTIVGSSLLGHSPAAQTRQTEAFANIFSSEGAVDIRMASPTDVENVRSMMDSAVRDETSQEEAVKKTLGVFKHVNDNSDDYTVSKMISVTKAMNNKAVFDAMSNAEKDKVFSTAEMMVIDIADPAKKRLDEIGNFTHMPFKQGMEQLSVPGATPRTVTMKITDYAELNVTDAGLRYTIKDDFKSNRAFQQRLIKVNKELDDINPIIDILHNTSGIGKEELAIQYFDFEFPTEGEDTTTEEQPSRNLAAEWWEETFETPTIVPTEEQRQERMRELFGGEGEVVEEEGEE